MSCAETTLALGAYALGSLEPGEHCAVAEHLRSCPTCAGELANIAGVPALLTRVGPEEIFTAIPPPDLYERVVAAAGHADHQRRWRWLVAVAAAVVLLAGLGTGLAVVVRHGPTPTTVTAASGAVHISVTAMAADRGTGTTLRVSVAGLPVNEHCRLIAEARDGSRHAAGDWVASYTGNAQVTESTEVARADLQRLTLLGTDGRQLVTVAL